MRVAFVVVNKAEHQLMTAQNLSAGMARFGDEGDVFTSATDMRRSGKVFDAVSVWGWRRAIEWRAQNFNVLLMERAYVKDRFLYTSLGWNGLNGRALWPTVADYGARWRSQFSHLVKPWKFAPGEKPRGYALILGQVPTDAAVKNIVFMQWVINTASKLKALGFSVRYRAHPTALYCRVPDEHCETIEGTLEDALAGAALAVTYNSNSGVDAVLSGVPTFSDDAGSMAWDVSSHDLAAPFYMPDRSDWCMRLAWRQWLQEELSSGVAWAAVKTAIPKRLQGIEQRRSSGAVG